MDDNNTKIKRTKVIVRENAGSGAIYGLGMIGAVIFFVQHATSFPEGLIGVVKGIFWPAVVVYKVLEMMF